jgi:hypothetical protein
MEREIMTTLRTLALTILVGIAFSLGSIAQAGTLYNNLGAVSDGTDPLIFLGPLADSFSTGPATTLDDVKLLLRTSFIDTSSSTVSLLSDNATSPGSLIAQLGSISDSSLPVGSLAVVDFAAFTPIALAANTRYLIELTSTVFSSAVWSFQMTSVVRALRANSFPATTMSCPIPCPLSRCGSTRSATPLCRSH